MFEFNDKKLYKPFSNDIDKPQIFFFLKKILAADISFFWISLVYSVAIGLLSLTVPISVQFLINSVAFTGLLQPIIVMGIIIFILLGFYGLLSLLQYYLTEIFQRRFFARMASEVGLKILNADPQKFEESHRSELVNRFFETIIIQKKIPSFLTKTLTAILQTIAGLLLISFYHPIFFVFSILTVISVSLIWFMFYEKAVVSAFYESRKKYDLIGWLEDISNNYEIFKSRVGYDYAKSKIDFITGKYLESRKKHFKNIFSQSVLLFAFYAVFMTAILVIGALLVYEGQLTIGQLVASELVMSAVLYTISQLGQDFENFYDVVAACEKLSQFSNIPTESNSRLTISEDKIDVRFKEVCCDYADHEYKFNFDFEAGKKYLISPKGFSTQKIIIDLILGYRSAKSGLVQFNGQNADKFDKYDLRSKITIIDNSQLIEGTVGEYLSFNRRDLSQSDVLQVIKNIGLDEDLSRFKDGLETRIIPSGYPFSESEQLLLKIARAIINNSKVVIITEIVDMLILQARKNMIKNLTKNHDVTLIYFSHRVDDFADFDKYLFVDKTNSYELSSIEKLDEFEKKYKGK